MKSGTKNYNTEKTYRWFQRVWTSWIHVNPVTRFDPGSCAQRLVTSGYVEPVTSLAATSYADTQPSRLASYGKLKQRSIDISLMAPTHSTVTLCYKRKNNRTTTQTVTVWSCLNGYQNHGQYRWKPSCGLCANAIEVLLKSGSSSTQTEADIPLPRRERESPEKWMNSFWTDQSGEQGTTSTQFHYFEHQTIVGLTSWYSNSLNTVNCRDTPPPSASLSNPSETSK